MSDATIYYRMRASKDAKGNWQADENGGWRFLSVPTGKGRRPEWVAAAEKTAAAGGRGFQFRFADAGGKIQWSEQYESIEKTESAAGNAPKVAAAAARGLTLQEAAADPNRLALRTAVEQFLARRTRNHKDRTIGQYTYVLTEFLEMLPRSIKFVDQIEDTRVIQHGERTSQALAEFQSKLEADGASKRTVKNKLLTVAFMLKAAGIVQPTKLMTMPKIGKKIAVPYSRDELVKIMAKVAAADKLAMDFFLSTGCREQEVQHAQWADLDLEANKYHVREKAWTAPNGLPKSFTVKNYEDRFVPLSSDVAARLKQHKAERGRHAVWVFPNAEGQPDGHLLRILKNAAKKAEVSGEIKLHRLRKTAATRWLKQGVPVRTIQAWLGHKSLETTQIYLGVEDFATQAAAINAPAY